MKLFEGRERLTALVVIVLVILVGGFIVIHKNKPKPVSSAVVTVIDPSKTYSFEVPGNWKIGTSKSSAPPANADLSVQTDIENTTVQIPGAPIVYGTVHNFIGIQLNQTSDMKDLFCENITTVCNPESLTINGNPALFERTVYNTTDNEVMDVFAINHGSKTVEGYFIESRQKSYTPTVPGTNKPSNVTLPAFNESGSYGAFRTLVHTIKFLNQS